MTICIGALAKIGFNSQSCIVLCFDSKVATESFASETEHKFHVLSDQVMALAADRPGRAKELAVIYRDVLASTVLTESNMLDALRRPIETFKRRLGSAYVGRKLGLSYEEFLNNGVNWLGQSAFDKYRADIEGNPLRVEMIIAGFIGGKPFLVELRNEELDRVTNFSLIGSGAYTAEPALHARGQTANTSFSEALYNVYEAKKMAEYSPFVGAETRMFVLKPPQDGETKLDIEVLEQRGEKFLIQSFKDYGPKPLPPNFVIPVGSFLHGLY